MPTQTFFDLTEEKQNRVVQAAVHEFSIHPYSKVSIQSIVDAASIPRGSFYQYFSGKDDLYIYCLSSVQSRLFQQIYEDEPDYVWKLLYSPDRIHDKNSDWYQKLSGRISASVTEDENRLLSAPSSAPHNVRVAAYCENAIQGYYPYFLHQIERQNKISESERRDILAFFLSMMDFLSYEYSYANNVSFDDAFNKIRNGVRLISNASLDSEESAVLSSSFSLSQLCRKLNMLSITGLHIISSAGTDIQVSFSPESCWTADEAGFSVRIPVSGDRLTGSASISVGQVLPDLEQDFCGITLYGIQQDYEVSEQTLAVSELHITGIQNPCVISASQITCIAYCADQTRICLIDRGYLNV